MMCYVDLDLVWQGSGQRDGCDYVLPPDESCGAGHATLSS